MGACFLWHVIQDTSANMLGILDEEKSRITSPAIWWNYQLRTVGAEAARYPWTRLWPPPAFLQGDPVSGIQYLLGQDGSDTRTFEPWDQFNGGNYRPGYVQGRCTTAAGVALAGAEVVLSLSSTNQNVSTGITDGNGNYSLPTPFLAQNHFVYANYNSGLYVGSSVDTLTPNF